ncbi:hypothetical protein AVEN_226442-1 [Araneus ventricosus]|uniref:Uncharacterized protein n=1 Tax=Araneus ventricosus TaxID=182803 RepID=A0A4Y2PVI3_ARAVE|nr:hypothetical protein AVEN_226442-1 [Araneus ventricosus]
MRGENSPPCCLTGSEEVTASDTVEAEYFLLHMYWYRCCTHQWPSGLRYSMVKEHVSGEKSCGFYIVTNMESRFPAMLVLCLGREFYRGMYGNTWRMESSTTDHFGDLAKNLATKCGISKVLEFS